VFICAIYISRRIWLQIFIWFNNLWWGNSRKKRLKNLLQSKTEYKIYKMHCYVRLCPTQRLCIS